MNELGDNYLASVRDQYEDYPYPYRDPEDDRNRILRVREDTLPRVNHYCFHGRETFRNFNVLVAGGGTGDSSVFLALQLQDIGGHVTHLDLSESSIDIAKRRAEIHGLKNITFLRRSLLDLPSLGIGPFDYINCCGVLHHLAEPDAGLAALKAVMKPEGAMFLMLYGKVARAPVYQTQELLRLITADVPANSDKVSLSKGVLSALPKTNYFRRADQFAAEIPTMGDIGLFDLLLHPQDRAYTVPELYAFIEQAGLRFAGFADPLTRPWYDPLLHIKDAEVRAKVAAMPPRQQQAIGELITCRAMKHSIYATGADDRAALPTDIGNIPFFPLARLKRAFTTDVPNMLRKRQDPLTLKYDGDLQVTLDAAPRTIALLEAIDGERSIGEIVSVVKASEPNAAEEEVLESFQRIFAELSRYDTLLLRTHDAGAPVRDRYHTVT